VKGRDHASILKQVEGGVHFWARYRKKNSNIGGKTNLRRASCPSNRFSGPKKKKKATRAPLVEAQKISRTNTPEKLKQ